MPAVVAKKKPARKAAPKRGAVKSVAAPAAARLVPPPGLSATEFLKRLPPPAKDFDAAGVERMVALRASR